MSIGGMRADHAGSRFRRHRAYPPAEHYGIVVLRPRSQAKLAVLQLIATLIRLLNAERLEGNLWILQENGLRIREGTRD